MKGGRDRAALIGVAVLALVPVGLQGWSLWLRLGETTLPMAAAASAVPEPAAATQPPDLQAVMAFAPFGQTDEAVPVRDTLPMEAAAPGLALLGITLAASPDASRAIIADPGGSAQSYGPGEVLATGAVLIAVMADHVVLQSGAGESVLSFPEGPATGADTLPAQSPDVANAGGPDLMNLIPATVPPAAPAAPPLLTGIRLAMGQDPAGYVAGLGLVPEVDGYRVTEAADAALNDAGLRRGDLVIRVNGLAPGSPDRDLAILDAAAAAGTAVLEVRREGRTLTLTVPLQ